MSSDSSHQSCPFDRMRSGKKFSTKVLSTGVRRRPLSARAKRLSARVIHVSARDWLTFGRPETYRLMVPIFSPLKYFSSCASVSVHRLRFIKFLVRLERAWTNLATTSFPPVRKCPTVFRTSEEVTLRRWDEFEEPQLLHGHGPLS